MCKTWCHAARWRHLRSFCLLVQCAYILTILPFIPSRNFVCCINIHRCMAGLSHAFAIQMLLPTVIAVVAQHNTQPPSRLFSPISSPSPKQRLADETNKLREVALGDLQPTNNNNNNKQAAKKKWNEVNVNRNILVFRMFYRIVFDLLLVCAECVTNFVCVCVFFFLFSSLSFFWYYCRFWWLLFLAHTGAHSQNNPGLF